jgi:hypothetical protein
VNKGTRNWLPQIRFVQGAPSIRRRYGCGGASYLGDPILTAEVFSWLSSVPLDKYKEKIYKISSPGRGARGSVFD